MNENTISYKLDRIKNSTDRMRAKTGAVTGAIEDVATAVEDMSVINNQDKEITENGSYSAEEGYTGFDRLGLQAQFRSWISAYNAVTGDYGLKLFLYSDMGKTIEIDKDKDKKENFLDTLKITEIKFGS